MRISADWYKRHRDLVNGVARADQNVAGLQVDLVTKPHEVEEPPPSQWKEC